MISKEIFVKTINKLEELDNKMNKVDEALQSLSPDFGGFYMPDIFDITVNILRDAFQDKDDWIGYFIYERDWLHKFELGDIIINNTAIKIDGWEDVYDFLINNMKE